MKRIELPFQRSADLQIGSVRFANRVKPNWSSAPRPNQVRA